MSYTNVKTYEKVSHIARLMRKEYDTKLFGVFLYGSQNYGLDHGDSDVDVYILLYPQFHDLYNNKLVSKEIETPYGIGVVKDVRLFLNMFKKGNPSCLEAFYTPYKVVYTKDRGEEVGPTHSEIEAFARSFVIANRKQVLKALYGTMSGHFANAQKHYKDKKFLKKQAKHVFRCYHIATNVFNGKLEVEDLFLVGEETMRDYRNFKDDGATIENLESRFVTNLNFIDDYIDRADNFYFGNVDKANEVMENFEYKIKQRVWFFV